MSNDTEHPERLARRQAAWNVCRHCDGYACEEGCGRQGAAWASNGVEGLWGRDARNVFDGIALIIVWAYLLLTYINDKRGKARSIVEADTDE